MEFTQSTVGIHLDIIRKRTISANLLGMIQGSDPQLKKEFVIIGAHLDHVGMNEQGYVFNGADDNGSGSVGVLQAAKAFALNPVRPKRSILFAHWTGEEKGLLGSRHFVAFPTVPLSDIVACINLDMICRNTALTSILEDFHDLGFDREALSQYPDQPEKIVTAFVSKPSPILADTSARLGKDHCGLIVVPLLSYPMLGNSDHFPFAQKGMPSIFFNTQGHRDLHQPSDTVEKINAGKMSQIVKLSYLLAFSIADSPDRPGWE
jgi:Zn-dependent M28 family amino/carboxypeptidase